MDLHYQSYHQDCTGEPVLLLHGLFGSATNWGSVARRLSDYPVIAPDLRNHGRSPHADDVSYAAMALDVIALLDRLQIQRVCLVGHSMGGKLAMQLALRYPQRVSALAVVDMAPVAYRHNFDTIFDALKRVDLARIKSRAEAAEQMAAPSLDEGVKAFLLQNLYKAADVWRWRINIPALSANYQAITGYPDVSQMTYPAKACFIYGERSDYVSSAYHPAIFNAFPNAELCPVAEAGHWVYVDQFDRFMRCLQIFLRR